jgi:hypothetical protein
MSTNKKFIIPQLRRNYNQTKKKSSNNNNNSYSKIKRLQSVIVDLLHPYGQFKNNIPFYLIEDKDFTDDFDISEYGNFLDFTAKSIIDFKRNKKNIQTYIYNPDELTEEDKEEILKKEETYSEYVDKDYHSDIMKKSIKSKHTIKNEDDYFFERKDDKDIVKMIRDIRLPNLYKCAESLNKSEDDKEYYLSEGNRLREIFDNNKDISLGELSDKIIWSKVSMLEPILANNNTKMDKIQHPNNMIEIFNKDENEKYLLQLMTYIPLEYFEKNENGKWKIKPNEMKQFLTDSYKKDNIQQIITGFVSDLDKDFFKQFRQLAHCYSFQVDLLNNCGDLVDWSNKMNFFVIYVFSKSLKKVFPIRFKMPKNDEVYNSNNNSYFFGKSYNLSPLLIFNKNPYIHIIGLTIFNTKYNSNLSNFSKINLKTIKNKTNKTKNKIRNRIFIILHCKIDLDKNGILPRQALMASMNRIKGISKKYADYNIFLSKIGNGLFEHQGFTHQEFMILNKFIKLQPYIIGGDKENLFYTARNESDIQLKELIEVLNMQKVNIVEDFKSSRQRIKIIT